MKKNLIALLALLVLSTAQAANTTLNLKDVEIATLITTVSEVTGKNFIVDSRVKGKVTVISARPMTPAGVYETFLGVLQVNGFAAIPDGQAIKIVPEANARQDGGVRTSDGKGLPIDDVVTYVLTLENVSAAQLVPVLRPMMSQWAHLAAYASGNQLILADRAANVQRMIQLIKQMDQSSDREIEFIKLEHAAASEVVRTLTSLVQADKNQDPAVKPAAVIADERSNSVMVAGDKSERQKLTKIIQKLDQPLKDDGATQVIYLRYASAENLAPILEGYAQQAASNAAGGAAAAATGGTTAGADKPRVLADKDTNALIVTANPKVMRQVRDVIAQLDIQRQQVLVEAIIAEVSANKSSQLGIDWAVFNDDRIAATGLFNTSPTAIAGAVAGSAATGSSSAAALGIIGQGATIVGGRTGGDTGTSFALILKALQGDGDSNVLSTPTLVTMDNEEAKFTAAREVPFLTGQFTNTGSGTAGSVNPFQTIERKDVGLTLSVTPQINEGGNVTLKLNLEASSLDAATSATLQAITNKRTVSNVVNVQDGQVLVIGGLIDDQLQDSQTGVPFLSKIPLIGGLFSSRSVNKQKRNLMVFIKPSILGKQSDADYYTRRKYDAVRAAQLEAGDRNINIPLIGGQRSILIPLEQYQADQAPKPPLTPQAAPAPAQETPAAPLPADGG